MNKIILKGQKECNKLFKFGMLEDGIYGNQCKVVSVKLIQWACNRDYKSGLVCDGIYGEATKKALAGHYVQINETQSMVKAVQLILLLNGYDPGTVDGGFGANTYNAVIAFQKAKGLKADGIVGNATFLALMHIADWHKYDPNNLPNFNRNEFKCNCGCGKDAIDELKCRAQLLRDMVGKPMEVNSGARCAAENARVGGVPNSMHLYGKAFDWDVGRHLTDAEIALYKEYAHQCGFDVGEYHRSGFLHCDLSGTGDFYGD